MKYSLLYTILVVFMFTSVSFAQDDTEEEANSAKTYTKEELQQEQRALNFEKFFMNALQQKSIENYDRALESLAQCQQIFPENIAMLFEMAKNHYVLKHYIEAHHYCDLALQIEPTNFWILALSREIFIKEQNYAAAIEVQKKLYNQKATEAENLLRLYYYKKDWINGQKLLKEIDYKNIYVANYDFYANYFNKKVKEKTSTSNVEISPKKEKTITELQTDFKKTNDFSVLNDLLTKEYNLKQYEVLLIDSKKGLSLYPTQAILYLYNGLALSNLDKPNQALLILEEGLDYVFDNPSLTKRFYKALISSSTTVKNTAKVNKYKKLVQKL